LFHRKAWRRSPHISVKAAGGHDYPFHDPGANESPEETESGRAVGRKVRVVVLAAWHGLGAGPVFGTVTMEELIVS
jgi:hypothetical protein